MNFFISNLENQQNSLYKNEGVVKWHKVMNDFEAKNSQDSLIKMPSFDNFV